MKHRYEAYSASGERSTGTIDAGTAAEAREQLKQRGLYALSVEAVGDDAAGTDRGDDLPAERAKILQPRLESLASFTRELSVLVATGVPVADALRAVERQEKDEAWAEIIGELRVAVERGRSLSEAMALRSEYFGTVYRSLVAAGEESGELDTMLTRLASIVRQQVVVRKAVAGALIYPSVLVFLSIASSVVMLLVVVPRFGEMFTSLDAELPVTTEMLLVASSILRSWWWVMIGGVAGAAVCMGVWVRSRHGRRVIDRAVLTAPVVSGIARGLGEARIARLLSTLLAAHLPLLEAVDLVAQSMTNSAYRRVIAEARKAVSAGDGLVTAFEASGIMTPRFVEAVRTGEATGRLSPVLASLSDHADHDNDASVKSLTKAIEPAIIGGMGIAIAFLALSLFLPLFDLTSAAGAG